MKHVSILIPNGHYSLVNVEGTYQIFSWVNDYLSQTNQEPLFELHLVGQSQKVTQTNGLFTITPDVLLDDVSATDLIVVPAIHGDLDENLKNNSDLVPWVLKHHEGGAEVVGLCIGAFFLAAIGLLDGKPCSTHWQFANKFRELFPKVHLMDHKIMTESDGIYTSGGAYSFTNLLIYLVEKYGGRDLAVLASKAFMIDIDRSSQSPFIIFSGQKAHQDQLVLDVQEFIEQHFETKISIDELAREFNIGRRTLERRFKRATSNTIVEYAQRVKIEAAKKELELGTTTVSETMYHVGYADTKAFRDVFRRFAGMSPVDYRNKYVRELSSYSE
ncbi:GlxA family transcriptional regulator [Sunxiuqinia elliptica]|uniref:Transcriptional regulator GlxA family, contains an amidase domain and an AraC-type DNA-binding HTH domain n=1 Tax=Sunxiuqinia elliptica TaxID=655355 RepID=A0A1I2JCA5_9BACT|nr:helix-turn-helix domain-containing protein [Sunxiuqinia elliptica]SFF51610.1 Transcriptional regulator GlxA family, contains an amidase domain and an AraC-type DNA-binding HTH domain [Sunxiuqinia elliptica]